MYGALKGSDLNDEWFKTFKNCLVSCLGDIFVMTTVDGVTANWSGVSTSGWNSDVVSSFQLTSARCLLPPELLESPCRRDNGLRL